MTELLKVQGVFKHYAEHTALHDVSLSVNEGEVFGLLGPNGAGKTSLIRIINQITAPDEGRILLKGAPLEPKDIVRVGYLPEERGLYPKMKVGEQAIYLAQLKGLSKRDARNKLCQWFEKFEIMPWWNKKVGELSKGMQQKVQFICTILHEPELLIFDEPFSGFDPINTKLLKDEIMALKAAGTTIIFSTHNMESVEEICDRIALINKSRKILEGSVHEIKRQHQSSLIDLRFFSHDTASSLQQDELFEVVSTRQDFEEQCVRIKKREGVSNAAILNHLAQQVELLAFNEVLPSMNDIFIDTVDASNRISHT